MEVLSSPPPSSEKAASPTHDSSRSFAPQPPIIFVFTGQGSQWPRMGVELLERDAFRRCFQACAAHLATLGCPFDLEHELRQTAGASQVNKPHTGQPLCTALQLSLVDEIASWGVRPSRVVGHSTGEIAAAYCAGFISREDAIAIAYFCGQAVSARQLPSDDASKEGMMVVACSPTTASHYTNATEYSDIAIACINSPKSVTMSGKILRLLKLAQQLRKDGIASQPLWITVAYHSRFMRDASGNYLELLHGLQVKTPAQNSPKLFSTVTGTVVDEAEQLKAQYWVRNLESPVLFSTALKQLILSADQQSREEGCKPRLVHGQRTESPDEKEIIIEIGPHSAMKSPVLQTLEDLGKSIQTVLYLSVLERGVDGGKSLSRLTNKLAEHNVTVNYD